MLKIRLHCSECGRFLSQGHYFTKYAKVFFYRCRIHGIRQRKRARLSFIEAIWEKTAEEAQQANLILGRLFDKRAPSLNEVNDAP